MSATGTLSSGLVRLIKDLYALHERGGITEAEARWILEIVLHDYGLTLKGLARLLQGGT